MTAKQRAIVRAHHKLGDGLPIEEYRQAALDELGDGATLSHEYVRQWIRISETDAHHTIRLRNGKLERVRLPSRSDRAIEDKLRSTRRKLARARYLSERHQRSKDAERTQAFAKVLAKIFNEPAVRMRAALEHRVTIEGVDVSITDAEFSLVRDALEHAT